MTASSRRRTRVGFVISNLGGGWVGGLNYYSNLLTAIAALPDRQIEIILLVPPDAANLTERFPADEVVRTRLVHSHGRRRLAGRAAQQTIGRNLVFEWLAARHHIDVFTHISPLGARSPLRVISWIPDFQHLRLPNFFPAAERAMRDRSNREIVEQAAAIVVSSHQALGDLLSHYPEAAMRARVLQFVTSHGRDDLQPSRGELASKYELDGPWFHLPNQLWKHKNHRLVIDAIGILRREGLSPLVVSTGNTEDFRHPGFLNEIKAQIAEQHVEKSFRILGLVPYASVTGLMHHSMAVINPSLFEGWSTSVEEAKSTGKRILLSDIPVHREQLPERSIFFPPDDPDALARAMKSVLKDYDIQIEERAAAAAAAELPQRLRSFARTFESIVSEVGTRTQRNKL